MQATGPPTHPSKDPLEYRGGLAGALAPLALFLAAVGWLGLSGAPDERGLWPVLLGCLALGIVLARKPADYVEAALGGMSRPVVMLMVMAWLLAGVLGALVNASGFVEALISLASRAGVTGGGFAALSFLICALVATATGTSLGTVIVCAPILYPAGGILGADLAVTMGAILGGATFGDNVSPISDTTIASATTQGADIGGVVRSRLKYALPASAVALALYVTMGSGGGEGTGETAFPDVPLQALAILIGPAVTLALLFRRRHLVESLMGGVVVTAALALGLGLVAPADLLSIDRERYLARGLLLQGMERGIGISVFTILLMGVVAGVEAGGVLERLTSRLRARSFGPRTVEAWIFATVSTAVIVTTHSVVAILGVGEFVRDTGEAAGVSAYRRANILDVTVCTYPFLLPFFIPTILAASLSASGSDFGVPRVAPLDVGLANFHSWALLGVVLIAIATGYGRGEGKG